MARRYRKRNTSPFDGIWFLVILIIIALGSQFQRSDAFTQLLIVSIIGVLIVTTIIVVMWRYRDTQRKQRALDIAAIDTMDPLEFEKYIAKLLAKRGFSNVSLTEKYDYGVDVIAHRDGIRWGVQVKRYSSLVKAEAVRQVFTALVRYKCDRAMVITNSTFSRPARGLAEDNNCVLIDRDELAEWIADFQEKG